MKRSMSQPTIGSLIVDEFGVTLVLRGIQGETMKRSMSRPTIDSLIVDEVGVGLFLRGIRDEELSQIDGLLNREAERQPSQSMTPNPEPDATVPERLCHD